MKVYEPKRDLLASVDNRAGGATVSKFDYTNDSIGRRTKRLDTLASAAPVTTCSLVAFLLAIPANFAGENALLWRFPSSPIRTVNRDQVNNLLGKPIPYSDSHTGTTIEWHRVAWMSSWGGTALSLQFMSNDPSNEEATSNSLYCQCRISSTQRGTNQIEVYDIVLDGADAQDMLRNLHSQKVFHDMSVLDFRVCEAKIITGDSSDIVIERWTPMSYLCLFRPGYLDVYHEESVKSYTTNCLAVLQKLKTMPKSNRARVTH